MRDRGRMTPTALAFMEQVDEFRRKNRGMSEEEAISVLRAKHHVLRPAKFEIVIGSPPAKVAERPVASRNRPPARIRKYMFKPFTWVGHHEPHVYIAHMYMELGRLGLNQYELSPHANGAMAVLSDLTSERSDVGNEAELFQWCNIKPDRLFQAPEGPYRARPIKPRIDISAYITSRDNLSVLWRPTDWRWGGSDNVSDFSYFNDDGGSWGSRPANELMFIRGVGNLRPETDDDYGGNFNRDVVDGIMICAVRAAYEKMIERLQEHFQVTVDTVFVFEESDELTRPFSSHGRVISWSLEDPVKLQKQRDREEYDAIETNYSFTVERFNEELRLAGEPTRRGDSTPMDYQITDRLTRRLKKAGFRVTPTVVQHLRDLIKRVETTGEIIDGRF